MYRIFNYSGYSVSIPKNANTNLSDILTYGVFAGDRGVAKLEFEKNRSKLEWFIKENRKFEELLYSLALEKVNEGYFVIVLCGNLHAIRLREKYPNEGIIVTGMRTTESFVGLAMEFLAMKSYREFIQGTF